MDLRQIEYIVKIAEEKSISQAAQKLFITQSALNQQLLKLENELGIKLFIRNQRNMYLTEAGEIYINNAREILRIKKETYSRIQDLADVKKMELSIGLIPERGTALFSAVYPEFYKLYPDIKIIPTELSVKEQLRYIDNGELDLGIVTLKEQHKANYNFIHICDEEFVLVVPASHPLADKGASYGYPLPGIPLDQFKNDPFLLIYSSSTMREVIEEFFTTANFRPNILIESLRCQTLLKMAEQGIGCTIIPKNYVYESDKVVYFSLPEPNKWEFSAAYQKGCYLSKPAKDFIRLLSEHMIKNVV